MIFTKTDSASNENGAEFDSDLSGLMLLTASGSKLTNDRDYKFD